MLDTGDDELLLDSVVALFSAKSLEDFGKQTSGTVSLSPSLAQLWLVSAGSGTCVQAEVRWCFLFSSCVKELRTQQ
jgi:hypothetical protein